MSNESKCLITGLDQDKCDCIACYVSRQKYSSDKKTENK